MHPAAKHTADQAPAPSPPIAGLATPSSLAPRVRGSGPLRAPCPLARRGVPAASLQWRAVP